MKYLIVEGGIITNVIVADCTYAKSIGAFDYYEGAGIGMQYIPPKMKNAKISELSTACNTTITAGCDVTLSDGSTGHISMTDEDQINLMSAMSTVGAGAAGYPYHLDGALCRVYSAADILTMGTAATRHKLYHTTYCNHLLVWVRRCETAAEVEAITYGCDLPEDLAGSLEEVLTSAATI